MNLHTNMILEVAGDFLDEPVSGIHEYSSDQQVPVYRIVWCKPGSEICYMIQMGCDNGMPRVANSSKVIASILNGTFKVLDPDDFVRVCSLNASDKQKERTKFLFDSLKDLIRNEPECFDPAFRSKTLSIISKQTGMRRDTLYVALRRYWQYGKTAIAMAPDFKGRGQRKQEVNKVGDDDNSTNMDEPHCERKRGRHGAFHGVGVSGRACQDIFELVLSTHPFAKMKRKLKDLYKYMIRSFYSGSAAYEVPSYKQFLYYKNKKRHEFLKRLFGSREFKKNYRGLTKDYLEGIHGPGSQFEIDATVADAFVIAQCLYGQFTDFSHQELTETELNNITNMVVGRPIVYAVRDAYSRLVVGLHIGIEGPGWMDAMSAMESAMTNMRSLLTLYNIDKTDLVLPDELCIEDVFPCSGIPEKLLGDNEVFDSKHLPEGLLELGVAVETAPVHRPDLKAIVERFFGLVQDIVKPHSPSIPLKPGDTRMKSDPRKRACLTLRDYVIVFVNACIKINTGIIESYPMTTEMVKDGLVPTPVNLWNWGIKNKTGLINKPPMVEFLSATLKRKKVTATREGLRFYKNLFYTCSTGEAEHWFYKGAPKRTVELLFDPRKMDEVYFYNQKNELEKCSMAGRSKRLYSGLGYDEIVHLTKFLEVKYFEHGFDNNKLELYDEKMAELVASAKKRSKPIVNDIATTRTRYKQKRREDIPVTFDRKEVVDDKRVKPSVYEVNNDNGSISDADVNVSEHTKSDGEGKTKRDNSYVSFDDVFDL